MWQRINVIQNNDQQHWSFYGITTDGPDFAQMGFFRNHLKFNDNNKRNDNKSKDNSNVGIFNHASNKSHF